MVILIHGGFWQAAYTQQLMAPLAVDLAAQGWSTANLEYRGTGPGPTAGGGWPRTLDDVRTGLRVVLGEATVAERRHVVVLGHSAGGQLTAWAAARVPALTGVVRAAISLSGVLDLTYAARTGLGGDSVQAFLGGTPAQVPQHYAEADPIRLLPTAVPVTAVYAAGDATVPPDQSLRYARAAGRRAIGVPGDHFSLIDPGSQAWTRIRALVAAAPA